MLHTEAHKTLGTATNEGKITPRWNIYISKSTPTISYVITYANIIWEDYITKSHIPACSPVLKHQIFQRHVRNAGETKPAIFPYEPLQLSQCTWKYHDKQHPV
jgi:hypothetical protein